MSSKTLMIVFILVLGSGCATNYETLEGSRVKIVTRGMAEGCALVAPLQVDVNASYKNQPNLENAVDLIRNQAASLGANTVRILEHIKAKNDRGLTHLYLFGEALYCPTKYMETTEGFTEFESSESWSIPEGADQKVPSIELKSMTEI